MEVRQGSIQSFYYGGNVVGQPASEQGRYLPPELYGAGPDKSVATIPTTSPTSATEAMQSPTMAETTATGRR